MWRSARKVVFPLALMILMSLVQAGPASDYVTEVTGTPVSGIISVDTVWNITGSPYNVTGNVTVAQNVTLTVDSGVEVLFSNYCAIYVEGTLTTLGTEANRTVFTATPGSQVPGIWFGIQVNSTGRALLNFTDIGYAQTAFSSISSNPVFIIGGLISDFEEKGIYIESASYVKLEDLNVTGRYPEYPCYYGILLKNTVNSTITNVTVSEVSVGIEIDGGTGVEISRSNVFNNYYGIQCSASRSSFENNTIHDNSGIGVWIIGRTLFAYNEVYRNSEYGVAMGWSSGHVIKENLVHSTSCVEPMPPTHGNGHGIVVFCYDPKCSGIRIEDNTVYGNCGRGIQTHHIVNSTIRNNWLGGYVRLLSSHYNIIEGNRFTPGGIVLEMDQHWLESPSHDNLVSNNSIGPNGYAAVILEDAYDNVISDNTILGNVIGVLLIGAGYNLIESNVIGENSIGVKAASGGWIWHPSLTNQMVSNQIYGGATGIFIEDAYEQDIRANCIYNNTQGIYVSSLSGYQNLGSNIIRGNSLILNPQGGYAEGGYVMWNSSYPSGGNFWSDYIGTDNFMGPNQDIPGSDGIGDAPYAVDSDDFDHYPLMESLCQPCDGVDLEVSSDEIVVVDDLPHYPWESLVVNVTVENIGAISAANVTVQVLDGSREEGTVIDGNKTIGSLQLGERANVSVIWHQPAKGTHLVCALVDPENLILELSKVNNYACTTVYIKEGSPPRPPTNMSAYLSGNAWENVTVRWDLSPDDSGLPSGVVRYDVFESGVYRWNGSTYTLIASVPTGQSFFEHEKNGEGDSSNHFYFVCAVNGFNLSSCSEDQAAKFTRPLSKGPNLVSIPLTQSNESMETVLQTVEYDTVWYYDSLSQQWKSYSKFKSYRTLNHMNHTMGVWINVTEDSNLTVAGIVPAQTTIYLYEGWNLVGFPSFNSSYTVLDLKAEVGSTRVEGFDSLPPYYLKVLEGLEVLQAGYGYWVRVEAEVLWIIEVA